MVSIGLDLGTGFVKCVSDYGYVRFPSLYIKRVHGAWTDKATEAIGNKAAQMMNTIGASAIRPINRGKPDSKYYKQTEMLIQEAINKVCNGITSNTKQEIKLVVGLPYYAHNEKNIITKLVKNAIKVSSCKVTAQAAGTLVDMDKQDGIVVSIGQGTTEIIVIDKYEVIDGESSTWASAFITKKIGKLAHLDTNKILKHRDLCRKYAKTLSENLAREILEVTDNYNNKYEIALSGGGIMIPGVKDELLSKLGILKVNIPKDPVMSNARGLYKLAK